MTGSFMMHCASGTSVITGMAGEYRAGTGALALHHPHLMTVVQRGFMGFAGERGLVGMQCVPLPAGRIILDVFADVLQFGFVADDVFPIIALP